MRIAVGVFGSLCALVIVLSTAWYGYSSSDDPTSGAFTAFLFGVISAGGIFFHAVASRLWSYNRLVSTIVGIAAVCALVVSVWNSIDFFHNRNAKAVGEQQHREKSSADLSAELQPIETERKILHFVHTTQEIVEASKSALSAAERARDAACVPVKQKTCGQRETDLATARASHTDNLRNKALTDRAATLDAKAEEVRNKLSTLNAEPPKTTSQGTALEKLFKLPTDVAETIGQTAIAAVVEILILLSLVSWEVLGHTPRSNTSAPVAPSTTAGDLEERKTIDQPKQQSLPKPKLVRGERKVNVADVLTNEAGSRVELNEVYSAYRERCAANDQEALSSDAFAAAVKHYCAKRSLLVQVQGDKAFLLNVKLSA